MFLRCKKCTETFPINTLNVGELSSCTVCGTPFQALVFPAILRRNDTSSSELVQADTDASCFYHSTKKASVVCDGCGLFICSLCDVELHKKHFCPQCIEKGQDKGKIKSLEKRRVLYDDIAVALALYPLLIWPFTIVTAPTSIFVALRYWKAPGPIIKRTKIKFILAILFATLEIVAWGVFGVFLFTNRTHA
jgi:hypothetical protein